MLIRAKQPTIDSKDPFGADKLGRIESATLLTQLLERVDTPFVLGLDAKWGDGKTTFVKMWRHHLDDAKIRSLYFNAWESDYSTDPLISFIGEMGQQLKLPDNVPLPKGLSAKLKKLEDAGASLAKHVMPVVVKVVTAAALSALKIPEDTIAALAADVTKEKLENYERDKNTVKNFKNRLEDFIEELRGHTDEAKRPVVFFVDELDRCRPTYTVELLERIKHFFDVEGLIFVLSIDQEQLGHSIKAVYGEGINVDGYLRRFIDLEYRLPKGRSDNFIAFLAELYRLEESLRRARLFDAIEEIPYALKTFTYLAEVFNLSLRAQEQTMAMLTLVILTARLEPHLLLLTSLAVMKVGDFSFYDGLIASRVTFKDVMDRVEASIAGRQFLDKDEGKIFEASLLSWKRNSDKTALDRSIEYVNVKDSDQGGHGQRARRITELIGYSSGTERVAKTIIKALEISGQFKE